jgi:DNA polymerase-3 subunit gamma/tau
MSYTVLARKYRPQTFADLVGQEHVSRTIGNAIQRGRVAHAFLFTGARGVGKTTTARLLAKALNCIEGPTPSPCNKCDACREIAAGNDIDVLEIDGASNNGVDDVRRLQETLPFRPARDRFKIVIVDEVHMLSTGAFNAFLKTLEEPPAHVKFVFATTEIHKVPVTIRSRCQRYDFRLIPHAVVAARVREILAAEQISADDAAIALVAREAAGSMRDALTVLDQVLALGDTELHGDSVARGLAIASREHVLAAIGSLLEADAAECLRRVHTVADQGLDLLHFTRQLLECARDLVVLRVVGEGEAPVTLAPDELVRARELAQAYERSEIERLFAGLTKLVEDVGQAGLPQMTLEMGLVRLAGRPPLVPMQDLIDRLKRFEDELAGGGPDSGPGGSRGGPGGARKPTIGSAPSSTRTMSSAPTRDSSAPRAFGAVDEPVSERALGGGPDVEPGSRPSTPPPNLRLASSDSSERGPRSVTPSPRSDLPLGAASANTAPPTASAANSFSGNRTLSAAPLRSAPDGAPPRPAPERPAFAAGATALRAVPDALPTPTAPALAKPVEPEPAPDPVTAPGPAIPQPGASEWSRIVSEIRSAQPALAAVLDHGMPIEVSPKTLRVGFPDGSFFGRQAQSQTAREALLKAAERVLGARPDLVIGSPGSAKVSTLAEIEETGRKSRQAARREAALAHPRVLDALEIFEESASSVDVQVDSE